MKYILILFAILSLNWHALSAEPELLNPVENNTKVTSEKIKAPANAIIQLTWLDLAFVNFFPVPGSRFADFSDVNFGGEVRVNFMIFNIKPLWISANFMMDFNKTNSIRLDSITDMAVSIGAGWRFTLFDRFFLTPRVAYGFMVHSTYGDYYNAPLIYPGDFRAGKKAYRLFSDTYLHYEAEFAYDISPPSRKIESEIFFSPSFIHFIEKVRQGFEIGYMIGIRARASTLFSAKAWEKSEKISATKTTPAILSGKVIDAETNFIFADTIPVITGGKTEKTELSNDETFAYFVDPGKDITLKAERPGYEPATQKIEGNILLPEKRVSVILALNAVKIWGVSGHIHELKSDDPISEVNIHIFLRKDTEKDEEKKLPTPVEEMIEKGDKMVSNTTGDFRKELVKETDYDIILLKDGYFTVRAEFSTKSKKPDWYDIMSYMNTPIQKAVVGAVMQFGNILFDTGKWNIRPDSVPVLDKMVQFLRDNPKIIVELGAHTDSMGPANENLVLSDKRAKSAVAYLISKGIPSSHISAKGYGETKLTNRCSDGVQCTPAEHQANRRTELMAKEILP